MDEERVPKVEYECGCGEVEVFAVSGLLGEDHRFCRRCSLVVEVSQEELRRALEDPTATGIVLQVRSIIVT